MAQRTVNARQLEVLEWIVEGCPEGKWSDITYKTVALALQNRRLVKVSKKGGVWRASATEAGRYFADHGEYPPDHWASSPSPATHPTPTAPVPSAVAAQPSAAPRVTGLRPVDQLVADVVDAGGELFVTEERSGYYENLVASAVRHNKVPQGKLLTVERAGSWHGRVVRLSDPPAWMTAILDPVPVSDTLRKPHPVVARLRDDRARLAMRRDTRNRALRILEALAKEGTRRGWTVDAPVAPNGYRVPHAELKLTVQGHSYELSIVELTTRVPHTPTATELREQQRSSWYRIPSHDHVPSGDLRIKIHDRWSGRREAFSDGKATKLDDQLAQLLQEIELRVADAEERQRRAEEAAAERRRQWELVRAEAEEKALEDHRAAVLADQVAGWDQANSIRAYLESMSQRVENLLDEARTAAEPWLTWCQEYVRSIDPLELQLSLPEKSEFSADELRPYMRGLSPHGPERTW